MIIKKVRAAYSMLSTKNRYILADKRRPAQRGKVNIDWWISPVEGTGINLGDGLAPTIVEWVLQRGSISRDDAKEGTKFLCTVGSILQAGLNDCTVWGSGLIDGGSSRLIVPRFKKMDIRAVRGPRTAETLRMRGYTCPGIYGDPAILMPLMYQPEDVERSEGVLFARHFKDKELFADDAFDMGTDDWRSYVDAVRRSSKVVTTSLHGIILAECYGTPAVLVSSNRRDYSLFKYEDWYHSTGRKAFPVAATVDEACALDPAPLPSPLLLDELLAGLLGAFPYDLYAG